MQEEKRNYKNHFRFAAEKAELIFTFTLFILFIFWIKNNASFYTDFT